MLWKTEYFPYCLEEKIDENEGLDFFWKLNLTCYKCDDKYNVNQRMCCFKIMWIYLFK